MSIDDQPTDAAVVRDLALQAAKPVLADRGNGENVSIVHVPIGGHVQTVDLERYDSTPDRATGTARLATVEAFTDYVLRHATRVGPVIDDRVTIWSHPTAGSLTAVFNDHAPAGEGPGWGDFRAELTLEPTLEWKHWTSRDGQLGSQAEFAEHIENGAQEIRDPAAATMLEIAQTFHATIGGTFRSAMRLQDGSIGLRWEEDVAAKAGAAGDLEMPREILLGLAPFIGEDAYQVLARVRYRVRNGDLTIGYQLDRPDAVLRDALDGIRRRVLDATGVPVYVGTAADPRRPRT